MKNIKEEKRPEDRPSDWWLKRLGPSGKWLECYKVLVKNYMP